MGVGIIHTMKRGRCVSNAFRSQLQQGKTDHGINKSKEAYLSLATSRPGICGPRLVSRFTGPPGTQAFSLFLLAMSIERPPSACLFHYCCKMAAAPLGRKEHSKSNRQRACQPNPSVSFQRFILNLSE